MIEGDGEGRGGREVEVDAQNTTGPNVTYARGELSSTALLEPPPAPGTRRQQSIVLMLACRFLYRIDIVVGAARVSYLVD